MRTEWTITKDYIGDGAANGTVGPRGAKMTAGQISVHPGARRFRMYDDDRVLYYEGYLVGNDWFAPLDDFGGPNAGCAGIKILEDGQWNWL